MNRRRRKKLARSLPDPTAATWEFWKSKHGKFAARFSIGFDGFALPFVEQLPNRFPHVVFGFPKTMKTQSLHLSSSNGLVTEPDWYWHRITVRFSDKLDPRITFVEVFKWLQTCARIEGGKVTPPDFPPNFGIRRVERAADVRKRLRRGRSYVSFPNR